jgi:DNA (cytosine-5)-methyltransferase 1
VRAETRNDRADYIRWERRLTMGRAPATHHRLADRRRTPTAVDLFCGAGGLTVGLKQAGFRVIGAVELDPVAADTYRANQRIPVLWTTDIRQLEATALMRTLSLRSGELDLLAGCPPCQGFSTMRTLKRRNSVPDDRNDLVVEFLRFVRVLRPRAVMLENVPGLNKDRRMRKFARVLRGMGYLVDQRIVDAADYGVPQRRQRMLLLATRGFFMTVPAPVPYVATVRETIGGLPRPGKSGDALHDVGESRRADVMDRIRRIPKNGGSRSDLPASSQLTCHSETNGFYDVYGRMAWNSVAPTITSGCSNPSKGRFLHPSQNRAITLREAALLQTFPAGYVFSMDRGKEHAAAMIGNALPPRMIKAFALAVKSDLRRHGHATRV